MLRVPGEARWHNRTEICGPEQEVMLAATVSLEDHLWFTVGSSGPVRGRCSSSQAEGPLFGVYEIMVSSVLFS